MHCSMIRRSPHQTCGNCWYQLCDLVAVSSGASRDAAAVAEGRGIRAARLRAIKTDIEANLALGDFSAEAAARRQNVSDSYIRKLFEGEHFILGIRA
jgi:hypothetical protein